MTKYEYLVSQKNEVIRKLKENVSKKDIATMYDVSISVLFKFLKEENISINSFNKYYIGQQIENLTLIKRCEKGWVVRCICGTVKEIDRTNIKKMKSCGCLRNKLTRERNRINAENLAGKIFGSVHVIELVDASVSMYNWKIHCNLCGKDKTMQTASIKRAKSCGCRMHGIVKDMANIIEGIGSNQDYINIIGEVKGKKITSSHRTFICLCPSCKKEINVRYGTVMRNITNKVKWICKECSVDKSDLISDRTAAKKMSTINTSGFIGVSLNKRLERYVCQLKYRGCYMTIGKYDANNDGLLQGAIDRDLYIIEHNLPHTRNFTDVELLQKLNKNELEKIEKYLIRNKDI